MATKRLIDANDAIERAKASDKIVKSSIWETGEVIEFLEDCPIVDAVEVVNGHWCWEGRFKACSVCGSYIDWDDTLGANHWSYCPYCGAKMDGDGNG